MHSRREFLERSLKGSSLFAMGAAVPMFVADTAQAAQAGKESVLVVVQLTGGNDGLNTVVPYEDDEYHKARPTLGLKKKEIIAIKDGIGFNKSLRGLSELYQNDSLAIVQGVGYPNPNRSHFESMDVWNTGDPKRKLGNGWLGRGLALLKSKSTGIPAFHIGDGDLPLALKGSAAGVPSLNTDKPFGLDLGGEFVGKNFSGHEHDHGFDPELRSKDHKQPAKSGKRLAARKQLVNDVAKYAPSDDGGLLDFVKQTSLTTYASVDRLQKLMKEDFKLPERYRYRRFGGGDDDNSLTFELTLAARMIRAGFGTRIFYLTFDGFDTHGSQRATHDGLLGTLAEAIGNFFRELKQSGNDKRVLLLTFSEFGRRVKENGSKGTDHGAGSCLFVAGPSVKTGLVGKHPSLKRDDLDRGDLKFHTDFRRVYATLLDEWLDCDSRRVFGEKFAPLKLLARG
ncbi:MAG: DUF1501 domain-containing protein [Planctomycetaceae bacterium]